MIDYDNELTKEIWLPQEPRLFVLYLGGKYESYSEENWMGNDEGSEEEEDDLIEDPRTHSENIDLKNINNFN